MIILISNHEWFFGANKSIKSSIYFDKAIEYKVIKLAWNQGCDSATRFRDCGTKNKIKLALSWSSGCLSLPPV